MLFLCEEYSFFILIKDVEHLIIIKYFKTSETYVDYCIYILAYDSLMVSILAPKNIFCLKDDKNEEKERK